jgi:hypothetical protein
MTIMQAPVIAGAPAPQVEAKVPAVTVYTDGKSQVIQVPKTHDEMAALIVQHDALKEQLGELKNQQRELTEELKFAPNEARPGLNAQLTDLSAQTIDLQRQINLIGREIASASPDLIATARQAAPAERLGTFGEGVGVGALGGIVIATTAVFLTRWVRGRFGRGETARTRLLAADDSERLKRLENGIDAMAIEIERISEGQRFVTKLMAESREVEPTTP